MKIMNEDGTISGSFINTLITFIYISLIITGVFYTPVMERIVKLENFMIWFFGVSFTVWSTKKTVEFIMGDKTIKSTTGENETQPLSK